MWHWAGVADDERVLLERGVAGCDQREGLDGGGSEDGVSVNEILAFAILESSEGN